jgi:NAD(P)-dependent dehydrogenase (short-subunit alcohol dehydrogenase family)
MKPLQDKVAIVTGSAQGMGLAFIEEFVRRGAIPVLADINGERLKGALDQVKAMDERAVSYVMDVTDKQQWSEMVSDVHKRFQRIDILINNAAIFTVKPFEEIPVEEWDRVFAVNVRGVFLGCQAVAPYMRAQKSGRIVNMSSQAGKTGGLLIGAHYSASKAAVICMTKSFAAALAPDNITVNSIAPGIINTDFLKGVPGIDSFFPRIPMGHKPGEAMDVAYAMCYLVSDEASYITGEILDVNGGLLMD